MTVPAFWSMTRTATGTSARTPGSAACAPLSCACSETTALAAVTIPAWRPRSLPGSTPADDAPATAAAASGGTAGPGAFGGTQAIVPAAQPPTRLMIMVFAAVRGPVCGRPRPGHLCPGPFTGPKERIDHGAARPALRAA